MSRRAHARHSSRPTRHPRETILQRSRVTGYETGSKTRFLWLPSPTRRGVGGEVHTHQQKYLPLGKLLLDTIPGCRYTTRQSCLLARFDQMATKYHVVRYLSPIGDDKEVATREPSLGMEIPGGGVSYASARIASMLSHRVCLARFTRIDVRALAYSLPSRLKNLVGSPHESAN